MSFNAVSKHVKALEQAGLVRRRVQGREHYCALEPAPLRRVTRWLDEYRVFWDQRLDAPRRVPTPKAGDEAPGEAAMTESERSLRLVRVLPASPEEAFDAWTDAKSIREWMCPGAISEAVATLDVRINGRFTITMKGPSGDLVHTGQYLAVDRPRRLVFTWVSNRLRGRTTQVTIELQPHGTAGTRLTLVHEDMPDAEASANHERGWGQILTKLETCLRRGR
jgi:uncharacterized protein YndB with AHSA1/START domain